MPYGYSLSAPIPPVAAVPTFQLDPSLGGDEWAELARTNPNGFLSTLLAALAAPNPVSSAGPTVEEAFKSHLVSLAPNPTQMQPIPSLYSILKTFWLPSSPAYFSLTASASTARTPSEHRFLYWDPQPLVFNGIACPNCSAPLINKGRISSGPIKIYDIEKPFFIVGCEYACRSSPCIAATSSEGRKFASTDPSIFRSLPMLLKDEFPARLLQGDADSGCGPNVWNWKAMGVSTGLWNLIMGGLRAGVRKEMILGMIWAVQHKLPDVPPENPTAPSAQPQPQQQEEQNHDGEADKMETEEGEEEEVHNEVNKSDAGAAPDPSQAQAISSTVRIDIIFFGSQQTHSSQNFSDAYGDAWREHAGMVDASPKEQPTASSTSAPAQLPASSPAPAASSSTTTGQPTMMQNASAYTAYPAYPFTPFSFVPHHLVNGQGLPLGQPSPAVSASGSGSNAAEGGALANVTQNKRSPRHCCKCGSQDCKGKGGRSFCMNNCQDCGKLECKGRNSRRPDKKCSEGWS